MGEITQEALNIMLQDGKTKDNLKQVLSGVLENVAARAVSEQIKAKNGSGNPEGGVIEYKRFVNAELKDKGTARAAGKGDKVKAKPVKVVIDTDKEIVEELQGKDVKLFVTGQKGFNILKKEQERLGFEIVKTYQSFTDGDGAAAGTAIAEDMSRYFLENKIDSMSIVTTRFKNMMSYSVENWDILPLKADYGEDEISYSSDFEFEPGLTVILSKLVPYYVANIIYQALLEAAASELASRMTAMSAASKNASEMISKLTVDYNKARQWAITQELTEVVAGADAQK